MQEKISNQVQQTPSVEVSINTDKSPLAQRLGAENFSILFDFIEKRFCSWSKCGCGGLIELKEWHRWYKIPEFINGHNMKGDYNPHLGKKRPDIAGINSPMHRPEIAQKISRALKGRKIPQEMKIRISQKLKGRKFSEATLQKMRGHKKTPEQRKAMSELRYKLIREGKVRICRGDAHPSRRNPELGKKHSEWMKTHSHLIQWKDNHERVRLVSQKVSNKLTNGEREIPHFSKVG